MRIAILGIFLSMIAIAAEFADRWVYYGAGLSTPERLAHAKEIIAVAKAKQLNGMLLSCGLENYAHWDDRRKAYFLELKKASEEAGVEIIPILWSIGYGTMLGRDRNLAAGMPVRDLPFVVTGDEARFSGGKSIMFENGDFERVENNRFPGFRMIDNQGTTCVADYENVSPEGGRCCIRLDASKTDQHGHARLMQSLKMEPNQFYEFSCDFKCKDLKASEAFLLQAYTGGAKGRCFASCRPKPQATSGWKKYTLCFNTSDNADFNLYLGLWGAHEGTAWVDNIQVRKLGIMNLLRRPGAPVTVKSAKDGRVYEEGRDYAPLQAWKESSKEPQEAIQVIKLLPGTRIPDKETLLVTYYQSVRVMDHQFPVCMSEPKLYEYFRESAKTIQEVLAPKKWFLSMDEIRAGGTCHACEARHTDMAHILADCIGKQREIIRSVNPQAEIYIWSDMLDPNHNAVESYYCAKGSFLGVWDLVPKDLVISCWYYSRRERSMAFFSERGFRTQGAAYYDTDTLKNCEDWLETCKKTPKCTGIMYTSWRDKYQLLPAFGDMLLKEAANE